MLVSTEVKKEVEEGDEPRAETESESEEELSCFAPTVCMDSHLSTEATASSLNPVAAE